MALGTDPAPSAADLGAPPFIWPVRQAGAMILAGEFPRPSLFMHAGIFHALLCYDFWKARRHLSK